MKIPRGIVALECNYPDRLASEVGQENANEGEKLIDWTARALREWSGIVDRAVVITLPGESEFVFKELSSAGLPIIPGVKSSQFTTSDGLADHCRKVAAMTKSKIVAIDNESKLNTPFLDSARIMISNAAKRMGEHGIAPLWFAPDLPRQVEKQLTYGPIIQAMANANTNGIFVTAYNGYTEVMKWVDTMIAKEVMKRMVGKGRCWPVAYVRTSGFWDDPQNPDAAPNRVWTPLDFAESVNEAFWKYTKNLLGKRTNPIIVYPGQSAIRAGEIISAY